MKVHLAGTRASTSQMLSLWFVAIYAGGVGVSLIALTWPWIDLLQTIVMTVWVVGPVALAAWGGRSSRSAWMVRTFLILQLLAAVSTIWSWTYLVMVPDAQNGIMMMLVPAVQYAAMTVAFPIMLLCGWRPFMIKGARQGA